MSKKNEAPEAKQDDTVHQTPTTGARLEVDGVKIPMNPAISAAMEEDRIRRNKEDAEKQLAADAKK